MSTVPRKKVALVGTASTTLNDTPWHDHSFEIWGLAWITLPRCDRFFDLHAIKGRPKTPPNYEKFLNSLGKPVYLQKTHPEIERSVQYPIEKIEDFFGKDLDKFADGRYFVSTFSYMMMLAIFEGFEEIHIFGFDMIADSEYGFQKPNSEYLVGIARGRGISVYIPEKSALCKHDTRYGYDTREIEGPLDLKALEERIENYKKRQNDALTKYHQLTGCLEEAKSLRELLLQYKRGGSHHKIKY